MLASVSRCGLVSKQRCFTSWKIASTLPRSFSGINYQADGHKDDITNCNKEYEGILQIQNMGSRGLGLVSQRKFEAGDLVMSAKALSVADKPDSHSVQKDWNKHVTMDLPAILINHSCTANVGIKDNDEVFDFFAIKTIENGEELTWDYEASEYEISGTFPCECGSPACRGSSVLGYKTNSEINLPLAFFD
eukprot:Nitzschia sp. Nitz4//scaffold205_size38804//21464//22485//NITZ4_007645-RA/size38804-snap-gene-0.8-mRNA-1//1//CDS//3329541516//5560//frame0